MQQTTPKGEDHTVIRYRVRSLGSHHCGYQVWRNQISKEAQEIYVANLERSLHEDSSCELKLQDIFRAAVAALSPPRLLPMSEYGRFHERPRRDGRLR